ncbi:sulfite exporter TauE/SafE family protein [soil metagenome]
MLVALALFLSAIIRQISGFGFALLSMPLISFIAGIRVATPLVAITGTTIGLLMFTNCWQQADRKALIRLLVTGLIGVPLGVMLFSHLPDEWVKRGLGALLLIYCLYSLLMPELPLMQDGLLTAGFGLISGLLTGAFNTGGPPVVIYGTLRRWSPEEFRSTLQLYFLVTSAFAMLGHAVAGLWTSKILWFYLASLPALLLGLYLGDKINLMIPKQLFNRIIYGMLIVTGLLFFL